MTEITREILELAALAAGHTITSFEPVGLRGELVAMLGVNAAGYGIHWRPHTDIADAARLAVRMRIMSDINASSVEAFGDERYSNQRSLHDGTEPAAERAYCHAITLCAAEIGRRMKEAK